MWFPFSPTPQNYYGCQVFQDCVFSRSSLQVEPKEETGNSFLLGQPRCFQLSILGCASKAPIHKVKSVQPWCCTVLPTCGRSSRQASKGEMRGTKMFRLNNLLLQGQVSSIQLVASIHRQVMVDIAAFLLTGGAFSYGCRDHCQTCRSCHSSHMCTWLQWLLY